MRIRVPATTANLGAGFDCFGLALDIWMEVDVDYHTPGIEVITEGQGREHLPHDERNFFIRIINRILREWDDHPPVQNLHLHVKNDIPLSRGLGSSAAVTVAAVKIAAEIAHKRLSGLEAVNLAARMEGHADNVAAAYYGGMILTGMKDAQGYKTVQLPLLKNMPDVLLAIPNYPMRTVEARQVLPRQVSLYDAVYNSSRTALSVYAWMSGEYELLKTAMQDRIHQYYRMGIMPGATQMLKEAFLCEGIYGAALSGSGSTLIALGNMTGLSHLCEHWDRIWSEHKVQGRLEITSITREGIIVEEV